MQTIKDLDLKLVIEHNIGHLNNLFIKQTEISTFGQQKQKIGLGFAEKSLTSENC